MKILIDNGHGIDTKGKRSPDGRLLEYAQDRLLAHGVTTNAKLRTSEGDEFEVNNYITTLRKKSVTIVTRR